MLIEKKIVAQGYIHVIKSTSGTTSNEMSTTLLQTDIQTTPDISTLFHSGN